MVIARVLVTGSRRVTSSSGRCDHRSKRAEQWEEGSEAKESRQLALEAAEGRAPYGASGGSVLYLLDFSSGSLMSDFWLPWV